MYVNQTLKHEKPLIEDVFSYRKKHLNSYFFHIPSLFKFLIKRLPINLKNHADSENKKNRFDYLVADNDENNDCLRFEISSKKVNELLVQRKICAADIRCLDTNSQHCLKKMCLKTCLYKPISQSQDNLDLPESLVQMENHDL
jgi:hypothetical protein